MTLSLAELATSRRLPTQVVRRVFSDMMAHTVGTAVCQKETHKALIKFDLFSPSLLRN